MTSRDLDSTSNPAPGTPGQWLHRPLNVDGAADGPLAGRSFAVKDVIDVEGVPTSAGSPSWEATHLVPLRHASTVRALLDAGATLVGKAVSDELAYSVNGTNPHHGMPPNPAAPGHVPGGSSSGSASAVATGDVDLALGTDTGGSVRVPASYCGVFGIRPTWGATDTTRVVHLAPSFDTIGWFTRDAETMRSVGEVLLPPGDRQEQAALTLVPLGEAFDIARPDVGAAVLDGLRRTFGDAVTTPRRLGVDLRAWASVRYAIQTYETWQLHGAWAQPHLAKLGRGVRGRLEACEATTFEQYDAACRQRDEI
ncbi:MAG: amidase, partial [Actinomycetia bacterium]|nr:amidase [Actinomycetes bacterium]